MSRLYTPITIDENTEITIDVIERSIRRHQQELPRLERLQRYYFGQHAILAREKRADLKNRRIVCNHAKHITDAASGYFMGAPVSYKADESVEKASAETLKKWLETADSDGVDMDIAKAASIFGRAYELHYMSDANDPTPKLHCFTPLNAFVIYDDTVERREMAGVIYYPIYDVDGSQKGFKVSWMTPQACYKAKMSAEGTIDASSVAQEENPYKKVTLVEYLNNTDGVGDYETVLSLIDAYNILQSDRINDKEQFVDAILLIKGQILGDTEDEESQALRSIRKNKVMMIDADADAAFLTHPFDEASIEVLRRSIEEDIHKFSGVPCMSDKDFAGNASGVAMGYKLLGLDQIIKAKERCFQSGLKKRIERFASIMEAKGITPVKAQSIEIVFSRHLPVNEIEKAQVVATLNGIVPDETLLGTLPFVKDAAAAAKEIDKQKEEAAKRQQELFAGAQASGDEVKEHAEE